MGAFRCGEPHRSLAAGILFQIKQQKFTAILARDRQHLLAFDLEAVAGFEGLVGYSDGAAGYLEPAVGVAEGVGDGGAGCEGGGEEVGVGIKVEGTGVAVHGGEEVKLVGLGLDGEGLLLVFRGYAELVGHEPDLEHVEGLGGGGVHFAVADARAGRHVLQLAGAEDLA